MEIKDLKPILSSAREELQKLKGKARASRFSDILGSIDDHDARKLISAELGSLLYNQDSYSIKTLPVIGGAMLVITIFVLLLIPEPTGLLYLALRGSLALSLALIAVLLSGKVSFQHKVGNAAIKAGGPVAVFLAIYYMNPAQLSHSEWERTVPKGSSPTNTLHSATPLGSE